MKCPKCQYENPDNTLFCGKCGTKFTSPEEIKVTETLETPKEELTTGSTFADRYQIIEELGKGGMGKVYKAHDTEIKEKVALKLIKPEIAADKKTIERFRNELKFARKIVHKNVGRMYDIGKEEGSYFITMEYVPGQDLKGLIKQSRQLTVGTAISIAKQVCEGLVEAHRLGVIHRDLKPSNIMIDKEGNARIMDFGIARSLKAKGITDAGVMIGTPEYMSPEQVEGKEIDQRSDIYSLGVILYEMVTGRVPFEGETPFTIGVKHKSEIPKDPKELNTQIPDDLSSLVLRCLEKDKEKRYQSAGEVHSELTRIEKGIPTTERILPKRELESEKIKKIEWKKVILYGGVVAILSLLIIAVLSIFTGRREVVDSIAVLPLKNISGNPEQEYFSDGMTGALIAELAKISALERVISYTSVMQYKVMDKSLPEIARELNVDVIVEGSVLHAGDKVRIAIQLIKAMPEQHLWADDYERNFRDIIALQKEVAQAIAKEIKIAVTPEEQARLTSTRPVNPEAHEAYLKGRYYWNKWTEEGWKKALEYFQQSIEKDPLYALAYAGIADSFSLLGLWNLLPPKEAYPKAEAAAKMALEIDDMLAEAHTSLAAVKMFYDWDWEGAERELKRALELKPNYAIAHFLYGDLYLAVMGQLDKAMAEKKRAQELDPLSPIINVGVGQTFLYARQYDKAIEELKKLLAMEPEFSLACMYLWQAYEEKGMYKEATAENRKFLQLLGCSEEVVDTIKQTFVESGYAGAMQMVINVLSEDPKQKFWLADIYGRLNKTEQAFYWLEKAFKERDSKLLYIKVDPSYDNLHSDPRFAVLLRKMNLEK